MNEGDKLINQRIALPLCLKAKRFFYMMHFPSSRLQKQSACLKKEHFINRRPRNIPGSFMIQYF